MGKIAVGLVGFGSQGRRVANAILLQPDMDVKGIVLSEPDVTARMAFRKGLPIFSLVRESQRTFEKKGIQVSGYSHDLFDQVDLIVDCTPAGVGAQNKEKFYVKHGLKVVFQAGEDPTIAEIPAFISERDYERTRNARYIRLPCPHSVASVRTLSAIAERFGVKQVGSTIIRAGSETMRALAGPVDTLAPERVEEFERLVWEVEHHTGKGISVCGVRTPSLLLDVQTFFIQLERPASNEDVIKVLGETGRTVLLSRGHGLESTDSVFEFYRRTRATEGDIYETCVWEEQVRVREGIAQIVLTFDCHCVHIPEEMDAIRALAGQVTEYESRKLTDRALGIRPSAD